MLKYSSSHFHELLTSVQNALRRYVEDEQKKREAANDAWVFSLARGKWDHVKYASGDVPRVGSHPLSAQCSDACRHVKGLSTGQSRCDLRVGFRGGVYFC